MWTLALLISIWIIGAACVCLMKKIEPSNKMYPIWALSVVLWLTVHHLEMRQYM